MSNPRSTLSDRPGAPVQLTLDRGVVTPSTPGEYYDSRSMVKVFRHPSPRRGPHRPVFGPEGVALFRSAAPRPSSYL